MAKEARNRASKSTGGIKCRYADKCKLSWKGGAKCSARRCGDFKEPKK